MPNSLAVYPLLQPSQGKTALQALQEMGMEMGEGVSVGIEMKSELWRREEQYLFLLRCRRRSLMH